MLISPLLRKNPPYDPLNDFAFVSVFAIMPNVLVVNADLPIRNTRELIEYTKANPGKVNMSSAGVGSQSHLSGALLLAMGGFESVHVPHKGMAPAITDLMAGQVQVLLVSLTSVEAQMQSGRLRAIGVASSKRSPVMPDVPAINESLKGFEADSWFGIMMPAGTPREIVIKFNAEAQKILATQDVKERLLSQGGVPGGGGPEVLAERVKADVAKWGKVAKTAGVKIE